MEQTFQVPEISCGHCKQTIEGALQPLEGVAEASVNIEARSVFVRYEPTAVRETDLRTAIQDSGYTVAGTV